MIFLCLHKKSHSHKLTIKFAIKVITNLLISNKVHSHQTIRISPIHLLGRVLAKSKRRHTVRVIPRLTNCKICRVLLTTYAISAISRFMRMISIAKFRKKAQ
jgi:hypothetical protein